MAEFPEMGGLYGAPEPLECVQCGERVQLRQDSMGRWCWRSETSGDSFSAVGFSTQRGALAAHGRYIARQQGTPPPEPPGARFQAEPNNAEQYENWAGQDHGQK